MIKAVIFDCFGVLTKDWWREFCSTLPSGPVLDKAKALNHQYDAGLISLGDFVKALMETTGRDYKPIEAIFTNPKSVKNVQLFDYIRNLKPKYKIGMLSNVGTNWIREYFLDQEEQSLFDTMLFSYEVGLTKPDQKIYEMAAERLAVKPSECVFVDDQPRYCEAAEKTGMKSIAYENLRQMKAEMDNLLATGSNN